VRSHRWGDRDNRHGRSETRDRASGHTGTRARDDRDRLFFHRRAPGRAGDGGRDSVERVPTPICGRRGRAPAVIIEILFGRRTMRSIVATVATGSSPIAVSPLNMTRSRRRARRSRRRSLRRAWGPGNASLIRAFAWPPRPVGRSARRVARSPFGGAGPLRSASARRVTARDHDRVRDRDDLIQVLDAFTGLDLGHHHDVIAPERAANRDHVEGRSHEGDREDLEGLGAQRIQSRAIIVRGQSIVQ